MDETDLIARACETASAYLALGNESFEACGATFVRNRSTPRRYDANHVARVRTAGATEIEALIDQADIEFEGLGRRRFDTDALTPPPFVARLVLEGRYSISDTLWGVLEGDLRAAPKPVEIREVLSEKDWTAFAELERMWAEEERPGRVDPAAVADAVTSRRLKAPSVRGWLACVDGAPRAFFSSGPGENGVGMVEDLYTHPDFRHRGLATALIAHCIADARARGAAAVIIGADPNDTPKLMYVAMGFRPLFVSRNYLRLVEPHS